MRKLTNIILISAIILLGLNLEANSAVIGSQFVSNEIKKDLIEELQQKFTGKVEVNITSLPYETVNIPDGKIKIEAELSSKNFGSRSIVKVSIYVDSVKVKCFGARADIKVTDKVWVAKDWIKRGQSLADITFQEKEITSTTDNLPGKDFKYLSYRARTNIKPGEIIELKDIEKTPTVIKNSPVSVIFKTPQVSVTIPGVAVSSGATGDYIRVKSKKYKKDYIGKIIGKNLILVNI